MLLFYICEGYIMTRTRLPIAWGGRFRANFARTEPALPWVLVTFPQMTRNWDFSPFGLFGTFVLFFAWNKKNKINLDSLIINWVYCSLIFNQNQMSVFYNGIEDENVIVYIYCPIKCNFRYVWYTYSIITNLSNYKSYDWWSPT